MTEILDDDEKRAQAAYHSLSAAERRAYQEFADAQGLTPEGANREQRRRIAKQTATNRPRSSGGPGAKRKRK